MRSSNHDKMVEQGRIIARAMDRIKVDKKKNMIQAGERREEMLRTAAEEALSGGN